MLHFRFSILFAFRKLIGLSVSHQERRDFPKVIPEQDDATRGDFLADADIPKSSE